MNIIPNKKYLLENEAALERIAYSLAKSLKSGDLVILNGELGSGKTSFCRAIIQYFCGRETSVTSPTFNILQTYNTSSFTIYHYDLYRIDQEEELYELALEDALENNLTLIEWPTIAIKILPNELIKISLSIENNQHYCQINFLQ